MELKPCPFCGSTVSLDIDEEGEGIAILHSRQECKYEVIDIEGDVDKEVGYWNVRPIEDALQKRIAELELEWKRAEETIEFCNIYTKELEAELSTLHEANRWIPVGERRPSKADCITDIGGKLVPYVVAFINGYLYGLVHIDNFSDGVYTHWRPLPHPPGVE